MRIIKKLRFGQLTICYTFVSLFIVSNTFSIFAQTADKPKIYGHWLTGDATVEIRDCGDGTPCGYIVKLDAQPPQSAALLDKNNPKKSERTKTLVGTRMLHGFTRRKNLWRRGQIYNPANGKSYSSSMKLETYTRLAVKGCIGPFCQTQYWLRTIPDNQQRPIHVDQ